MASSAVDVNSQDNLDNKVVGSIVNSSSHTPLRQSQETIAPTRSQSIQDAFRFWMIIFALCLCFLISMLELNSVPTALPTIINRLGGTNYIWVGSAYTIAATGFIPVGGGLSQVFGRKPILILCVVIFAVGSAICGASSSMNMLIAGRTVQGLGGGGMIALPLVVLSDLVPLRQRGAFVGLLGLVWCFGAGIGPVVGGALAQHGQWRWLFYLNIPLCGLNCFILALFLTLKYPHGSLSEKLKSVDWVGSILIIGSSTSLAISLTWAGIQFSWSSAQVLAPMIISIFGFAAFLLYEARFAFKPLVPWEILANATSLSGYLQAFTMTMSVYIISYNLPIFFQACHDATPIAAGVDLFPATFVMPIFTLAAGISVKVYKVYRIQTYIGFVFMIAGMGALIGLSLNRSIHFPLGVEALYSAGAGIIYSASVYPVLAPLALKQHPSANAFLVFVRSFGQIWGITISGTVLQNQLQRRLPQDFFAQFPAGTSVAYSIIPLVPSLPEPLRTAVRTAFADSLKVGWIVGTAIVAFGLLCCLPMKGLKLHEVTDEDWGMEKGEKEVSA